MTLEGRQYRYTIIHFAGVDVGPCPRAVDGHRCFAFIKGSFCDGVIGVCIHVFVFNQVNQEGQTRFRASVIHAHVFNVVLAVFILERITPVSSNQRPGEVRFLQVEHQRALAFRFQFFIQRRDLFPGFWRVRQQIFVINQR